MKIQGEKSTWLLASLASQREDFMLTYAGEQVPQEKQATGLGVVLEARMTMNGHLEHLTKKAQAGVAVLKYAAAQNVTQASLHKLMKAIVCTRSDYGLHLAGCASKKAIEGLQRVENQAMRIVTGSTRKTATDALQHWLGVRSIRDRQQILGARAILKASTTPSHPLYQEVNTRQDEQVEQRLATVKSWVRYARDTVEAICPIENIRPDGWTEWHNHPLKTLAIGSREWRDQSDLINDILIQEFVEERAPTFVVATDGSIRNEITAWGGAIWKDGSSIFEWATGRNGRASSYRAEYEALEDAIVWLARNTEEGESAIIFTDSRSLVSRLQGGLFPTNWVATASNIRATVELVYIPGHAGIRYNVRADRLAGSAEAFGDLVPTPGDVVAQVSDQLAEQQSLAPGTWTLQRLKEMEVERGVGAKIQRRGPQRKIGSQLLFGTITEAILGELLEMLEGRGPRYLPESLLSW